MDPKETCYNEIKQHILDCAETGEHWAVVTDLSMKELVEAWHIADNLGLTLHIRPFENIFGEELCVYFQGLQESKKKMILRNDNTDFYRDISNIEDDAVDIVGETCQSLAKWPKEWILEALCWKELPEEAQQDTVTLTIDTEILMGHLLENGYTREGAEAAIDEGRDYLAGWYVEK